MSAGASRAQRAGLISRGWKATAGSGEKFDQAWYPGEALVTQVLVEQDGKTTLTVTVRYESREIRDGVLKSPMEQGVAASYDRLEELLSTLA